MKLKNILGLAVCLVGTGIYGAQNEAYKTIY